MKKSKINKILIIAFKFPPYPEVGAYRWAKFAKYFAESGLNVHVVTVNWNKSTEQTWFRDIKHGNIKIHRIKSGYIHKYKYKKFSDNPIGRFFKKIRNQILKISYIKHYIDEAQHWGKYLIPCCKKIIKEENINYVVATGGPFMTNYWAAVLKNKVPGIKLIQDFRDEWYEAERFKLNFQKKKSDQFRDFCLNNSDAVVSVSDGLIDYFNKLIKNNSIKEKIIFNGFDDLNVKINDNHKRDFTFIYAGSLSNGRDKVMSIFLDIINENIKKLNNINIIFYSPVNEVLKRKYKKLIDNNNLKFFNLIPQQELFEEINKCFCALHFMPETQKFIISIKLFEYAMLGKPVFSINYGGDTDKLIKDNKYGFSVNLNNKDEIKNSIFKIYELWKKNPGYTVKPKNLNKFSYKYLAEEYLDFIGKI